MESRGLSGRQFRGRTTPYARHTETMKDFLAEFWLWIAVPFVVVIGGLLLLYFLAGGDEASPFIYNLF